MCKGGRRFYPFFPFVGGRVCQAFIWHDRQFVRGEWVLFDLYGTNRDAREWEALDAFHPERCLDRDSGSFAFVPHGGGDAYAGRCCPGERITICEDRCEVPDPTKAL
ncbi:cytochrome P450 [Xanthobacteraceae bacterium Astr-EGSB]|uniref:cytochrome P450 n=1 Tax=Astrobacterium formosum TaxID=3069710 RepID=UPI0027AE9EA4|nr:cytochrome P450 [Xanthobacteraceae bacterium Astr-EGSB]